MITKRKARKIVAAWDTDLRHVTQPEVIHEAPSLATEIKRNADAIAKRKQQRVMRKQERKRGRQAWWGRHAEDLAFFAIIIIIILVLGGLFWMAAHPGPPSTACTHDKKMIALLRPKMEAAEIKFAANPTVAADGRLTRLREHYNDYDRDRSYDC